MRFYKVLAAGLLLAGTSAQAQTFDCDMYSQGNGGWVGSRMIFSLSREDSAGAVFDGLIKETYKHPIPATVVRRKDHIWRYTWKVEDAKSGNTGKETLQFSAILNTNSGKLSVNGTLQGYDNNISGAGKCKVVK